MGTTVRIAGVVKESIVDGPGIRLTLFTQGCPHGCPGCHNPQSHDPAGGYDCEIEKIVSEVKKNPLLTGITLSGGEPMLQAKPLLELAQEVRALGKSVLIYSGYTAEQLLVMGEQTPEILELLRLTDILVDGKYEESQRDLNLLFRGSKNQRVIDAKKTAETGIVQETTFSAAS